MKKLLIACAAVLALGLTSCGDTQMCYKVTSTYKALGVEMTTTDYVWTTKNDLKTYESKAKAAAELLGTEAKVSSFPVPGRSEEDCKE
ncbi:MAG: hypothetical protein J6T76_07260 [Paludibacteraceae bacterium]|jgi:hypothetical protein|nr:hypothetical protein [Paludibacteraceae bacterium]MBO7456178.1 hypothetical protein [Paludibacteraceae bacterium]